MGIVRNGESAAAIILCEGRGVSQNGESRIMDAGRWLNSITLQSEDKRLVTPFLDTIRVLTSDSKKVQHGIQMLAEAKNLLGRLQPALPDAFEALISDVIFVESTIESTDHIFSFSDDTAPNVLYIAPSAGETLLGADDLGDSLLHEFLHQVLYQMERDEPMLIDKVYPRFPAPWRDGLRPSGGFFHGTFVFAGLSQYWAALAKTDGTNVDFDKATDNAKRFAEQAAYGINSLRQFALLTPRGNALLNQLAAILDLKELRSPAPGLAAACYNGPHETEALSEKAVNRGEPASEISSPR
jgi:HEXXH motif-containing protein